MGVIREPRPQFPNPRSEAFQMAQIPAEATKLLEATNFADVGTLMPDGSPHVTPVWIGHEGDTVIFNTAKGRVKEKNLRRDPRVSVAVHNEENPYEYLMVRGKAREITEDGADENINDLSK